jgi:hypothetical protein
MEHDRPRWRFRISTLMLLVVIVALSLALVAERRKRWLAEERALVNEQMAREEAARARALVQQAQAQLVKLQEDAKGAIPRTSRAPLGKSSVEAGR